MIPPSEVRGLTSSPTSQERQETEEASVENQQALYQTLATLVTPDIRTMKLRESSDETFTHTTLLILENRRYKQLFAEWIQNILGQPWPHKEKRDFCNKICAIVTAFVQQIHERFRPSVSQNTIPKELKPYLTVAITHALESYFTAVGLIQGTDNFIVSLCDELESYRECLRQQVKMGLKEQAVAQLRNDLPAAEEFQRRKLVYGLIEDLQAGDSTSAWVIDLFNQIPKTLWPLLFLYFDHKICSQAYCGYWEEKLECYAHTSVRLDNPIQLGHFEGFITPARWVEITSRTLMEMVGNPHFKEQHGEDPMAWSMQRLYQATRLTNATHAMIQDFMEYAPREIVIPTLKALQRNCFSHSRETLQQLASTCLRRLPDKLSLFADYHYAHYIKERTLQRYCAADDSNLEGQLWHAPYLTDQAEVCNVTENLINKMGILFLDYLRDNPSIAVYILKSLHQRTPEVFQRVFNSWIASLCQSNYSTQRKLELLQTTSHYCFEADFSVEFIGPTTTVIRDWYVGLSPESLAPTTMGLSLFLFFSNHNVQALHNLVFSKMRALLTDTTNRDRLLDLNKFLEAIQDSSYQELFLLQLKEEKELISLIKQDFDQESHLWKVISSYDMIIPLIAFTEEFGKSTSYQNYLLQWAGNQQNFPSSFDKNLSWLQDCMRQQSRTVRFSLEMQLRDLFQPHSLTHHSKERKRIREV